MIDQLVSKTKLPYQCPQCENYAYMDTEEGKFHFGMMGFDYFCEKCEIKWTAYFKYTKDVIEPIDGQQIRFT
jgi:predicted SprT family Zn-dependent metalloprotease